MNDEILQIEKLVNQGSYLQAEKIAWSLHKSNPNNLQITKILGLVLLLQGNYLLAEKFYIEFMNKEPGDFDVNLNLAAIYAKTKSINYVKNLPYKQIILMTNILDLTSN